MKKTILPVLLMATSIYSTISKADDQIPPTEVVATPVVTPIAAPIVPTVILNDQINYYINANSVRVRSLPDLKTSKILGELSLNDRVKVINPTQIFNEKFVEIQVVKTFDPIVKSEKYYISIDMLSEKIVNYKEFVSKYFVVVNVASETLRMYERQCADNSCAHKMISEAEVVVGEDTDHPKEEPGKGRSVLGSYRVTSWAKFYQDPNNHYPAWYRDGYPAVPGQDASWNDWFSNKVMPLDEKGKHEGKMRGAFGWYTAMVAPEPFGQWTHGTLGWGADHDKYIKKVKGPLINIVSNPRSSGCTRNPNESIAFIRQMIAVGAPIVKIYAKEEVLDPTLKDYPNQTTAWNYVLTKNRNHAIDRNEVMKNLNVNDQDLNSYWESVRAGGSIVLDPKSPLNQVIEVGTYDYDSHPDAIKYTPGEKLGRIERSVGRKGNVYGVKEKDMHGVYYVDAGMLNEYAHPTSILEVSGFMDEVTPSWMSITNLKANQ